MQTHFRHAAVALMLLAGTGAASAQTYITRDAIDFEPLQLTPAQRTTIYRTIIPQGRGRAPIVRERIVTEPVVPRVRERIITRPIDDYAYDYRYDYDYRSDYAYAPRRVAPADAYSDYAYVVGSRVPPTVRLEPLPPAVVAEVPAVRPYRYMRYFDRVLLIDPVTSTVVADVSGY